MSRAWRIHQIDQLLHHRRVVSLEDFLDTLEVSRATFKRDLEFLRDQLNAPIVWDRELGGYRFDRQDAAGPKYELPGLWLSAAEAHALLGMQQLLEGVDAGLLGKHVAPLKARLDAILLAEGMDPAAVSRRVRIIQQQRRHGGGTHFEAVARATLERRRLRVRHLHRGKDEVSERELSPQRLVHYRENWYLDAWCHLRQDIRSFALDALQAVELLAGPALEVADAELDARLGNGYGIFSGSERHWAELLFSAERARWVAAQTWHPDQVGEWLADGRYRLRLPYNDDRELLGDVLAQVPEVEVLAPPALRVRLRAALSAGLVFNDSPEDH